MKAVGPK